VFQGWRMIIFGGLVAVLLGIALILLLIVMAPSVKKKREEAFLEA
jgi:flagellar biosynthesis protein FliP